jgi:hypothetical protein
MEDSLLHFGGDGTFARHELTPDCVSYDPLLPLGDGMVAAIFAEREGYVRVRVLDGVGGGIYLDETVPGSQSRRIELRRDGRWLFVLEQDAERAFRLDLEFRSPPLAFGLPIPMSRRDQQGAVAMDGGLAYLARGEDGAGTAVRAIPGRAPWTLRFAESDLAPVPCAEGLAWIPHPLDPAAARSAERVLYWLGPGADAAWSRALGGAEVRVAELEFPRPFDARGAEAIVLSREADGATRITAHPFGAAAPSWSLRLADPPYDALRPLLPQPRPAADGWAICLLQSQTPEARARMHLLLVGAGGALIAQRSLNAGRGSVTEFWAEPVTDGLLVRNGDRYLLLGESE